MNADALPAVTGHLTHRQHFQRYYANGRPAKL